MSWNRKSESWKAENYGITIQGKDCLSCSGNGGNEEVLHAREEFANRIKAASNELMTGISHDLRTPLTALIGYLEILEGEDIPAGQSPFLKKCPTRAYHIKSLISEKLASHPFGWFFLRKFAVILCVRRKSAKFCRRLHQTTG